MQVAEAFGALFRERAVDLATTAVEAEPDRLERPVRGFGGQRDGCARQENGQDGENRDGSAVQGEGTFEREDELDRRHELEKVRGRGDGRTGVHGRKDGE